MSNLADKNILILGGLGFLGSNLALRLIGLGSHVTIYDPLLPGYGGNIFNIHPYQKDVRIIKKDIRDHKSLAKAIENQNIIFNFAAQVSYIDSLNDPFMDLDINVKGQLLLLEICRKINPQARLFFSSSRLVYGKNKRSEVKEDAPTKPLNLYGIHKLTSEQYMELYSREFNISSTVFRITNPYGPRQQMIHSKYSIVGWFIRQAMEDKVIKIFGDGLQERDYIFSIDIINAFIAVAEKSLKGYHCFNVGNGIGVKFKTMVETILKIINKGRLEFVKWPKNYKSIETGSFIANTSLLNKYTNWKSSTNLIEGIKKTYLYYKKYQNYYWI